MHENLGRGEIWKYEKDDFSLSLDILADCRILDSKWFFLRILKALFHSLIVAIVAIENFAALLISKLLYFTFISHLSLILKASL